MPGINEIKSAAWQLKNGAINEIVTGIDDIDQSINIILTTPRGSVPMDPEFGAGLHELIDAPVGEVAPQMVVETIRSLKRWEPRITVNSVTVDGDYAAGHVTLTITYTVKSTNSTRTTQVIL
ncbi:MAG TPA: GPW/gp25 family protein [bacterium]|nr:GPW/gp25 family protein [bacterium]